MNCGSPIDKIRKQWRKLSMLMRSASRYSLPWRRSSLAPALPQQAGSGLR